MQDGEQTRSGEDPVFCLCHRRIRPGSGGDGGEGGEVFGVDDVISSVKAVRTLERVEFQHWDDRHQRWGPHKLTTHRTRMHRIPQAASTCSEVVAAAAAVVAAPRVHTALTQKRKTNNLVEDTINFPCSSPEH